MCVSVCVCLRARALLCLSPLEVRYFFANITDFHVRASKVGQVTVVMERYNWWFFQVKF